MNTRVYAYTSYLPYLADVVQELRTSRKSLRALALKCGFKSGNYVQLLATGQRKLTERAARQIGVSLSLPKREQEYLTLLARLDLAMETEEKLEILSEMKRLAVLESGHTTSDFSMSSHWLYGVIYEMACSKTEPLTPESIFRRLTTATTHADIVDAIHFLKSKGYLIPTDRDGFYERKYVSFERSDDIRRIEVQRNHLRFLDMSKHRLNDDVNLREFQGLTVGIPKGYFSVVKQKIREFSDELNRSLSQEQDIHSVIRVQMAAFYLTKA